MVKDYHSELLTITSLSLYNTNIDQQFLNILKKYFKNLKNIIFHNCIIKENCNFSLLSIEDLHFCNCNIQNITSLRYCKQDLVLSKCKVEKITNVVLNSNKIVLDNFNDEVLANLFLYSHFPNLKELNIKNRIYYKFNCPTYNKCLTFLPYACPNLMKLKLTGQLFSFSFLNHFHNLKSCSIYSIDNSIGPYSILLPYITNSMERNKI